MTLELSDEELFELLLTLGAASKGRLSKERRLEAQRAAARLQSILGEVRALRSLTPPPPTARPPAPRSRLWPVVGAAWLAVLALYLLLR